MWNGAAIDRVATARRGLTEQRILPETTPAAAEEATALPSAVANARSDPLVCAPEQTTLAFVQ
jgi:hypothetical protein